MQGMQIFLGEGVERSVIEDSAICIARGKGKFSTHSLYLGTSQREKNLKAILVLFVGYIVDISGFF